MSGHKPHTPRLKKNPVDMADDLPGKGAYIQIKNFTKEKRVENELSMTFVVIQYDCHICNVWRYIATWIHISELMFAITNACKVNTCTNDTHKCVEKNTHWKEPS